MVEFTNQTPTDVANQALDAIGADFTLGDIQEGTKPAQTLLRAYGQGVRQLLRAANWDFARKTTPLTLLADASGNTANVGTIVPIPWIYEYAYPTDCMKVRFIPQNWGQTPAIPTTNIQLPTTPATTVSGSPVYTGQRTIPSRFVVATDPNYPVDPASITSEVQGVGPDTRTVILSNVPDAQVIYTALVVYPSVWDNLFRQAMVAYLAQAVAMSALKDKKLARVMRGDQIAIAKDALRNARIADGNEGWYNSDLSVNWIDTRNSGFGSWTDGAGPGILWGGWDNCAFADGTAY